jgi:hypothetical protein
MWRACQTRQYAQYAAGGTVCIDRQAANISKARARKGSYERLFRASLFSNVMLDRGGIHSPTAIPIDLNAMLLQEPNQLGILRACVSFARSAASHE